MNIKSCNIKYCNIAKKTGLGPWILCSFLNFEREPTFRNSQIVISTSN